MAKAKWKNFSDEELKQIVAESISFREVQKKLGYKGNSGSIPEKLKQVFKEKENIQYAGFSLEDIETELYQKCALELDGDAFGFIIDDDGKRYKADFAVDINCLKQQKYNSVFLNKIINDINYYKMWDFQPQKSF